MKRRILLLLIVVALAGIVVFRSRIDRPPQPSSVTQTGAVVAVPTAHAPASPVSPPPTEGLSAETSTNAETAAASPEVQTEIDNVKLLIRDYRLALGENPVGSNAEITKALLGANAKKTKFVVPGDARLNDKGELVDPWRTPYFFHQLSAREMEIRSAGPDRRLWTDDDIVLR